MRPTLWVAGLLVLVLHHPDRIRHSAEGAVEDAGTLGFPLDEIADVRKQDLLLFPQVQLQLGGQPIEDRGDAPGVLWRYRASTRRRVPADVVREPARRAPRSTATNYIR